MSHPHRRGGFLWKRNMAIASRWLHTYLSLVSFAILLFFAVTGLTLNHQDWFAGAARSKQFHGSVDSRYLGQPVGKLEVVEYLRRTHGVKSALSDFRIDEGQLSVSFKGPGYSADAFIDRKTGAYDLTENRQGIVAVINDLHKGRDSGTAWSWVIDLSAWLMTLVSLSGLVLIFFVQKRRGTGLIAAAVGGAVCWLVYAIWVP